MAKRRKKVGRKAARKKTRKVARARRAAPARGKKVLAKIEEALEMPNRAAALLWGEPLPLERPAGKKKD